MKLVSPKSKPVIHCVDLRRHWQELHNRVAWDPDELDAAADMLKQYFDAVFHPIDFSHDRPAMQEFQKVVSQSKGAAGLDHWTTDEVHTIAHSSKAIEAVWDTMAFWEEVGRTPTLLREARLAHIPKEGNDSNVVEARALRPICFPGALPGMDYNLG